MSTIRDSDLQVKDIEDLEKVDGGQRRLLLILLFSFAGFIAWAALSPLDIVSIATGTVQPVSRLQTVQHLEGGIVSKLLVKGGDQVEQGQALVELETTSSGASYGEMLVRVRNLTAEHARLSAEVSGAEIVTFDDTFKAENPQLMERTVSLFNARRNQLASSLKSQQEEINVRTQAINEIKTHNKHSVQRLKLVKEQIKIEKALLDNALSNRYEHLERLKEVNRLDSEIGEGRASLNKARASLLQAESNLKNIQTKYNEEVNTLLSGTWGQLDEGRQLLAKYKDSLARTVLRAPMDGIIKNLYVVTEGGVVSPGGAVLDMVPGKEGLIVEGQLPPQDIGHVQLGEQVFIQLASADASHYGRIKGTVSNISPDTVTTEDGQVYYMVRVTMAQDFFEKGQNRYKLSPGVMVTAGIVTGKRSVLEYILSPFVQSLPFALTER